MTLSFFLVLLAAIQVGRGIGKKRRPENENGRAGTSSIEALVFALLGLLIAFTFSGAAQRLADRRNLIVQEVNAMGTAWLRIDLLAPADQPAMRDEFRKYVDARIDYYRHITDSARRQSIANRAADEQNLVWRMAMSAKDHAQPPLAASFIAAVNDMLDASTTLTVAQSVHPPLAIHLFLGVLAVMCGFLVGLNLAHEGTAGVFHQIVYALVVTTALYIIIDFEYPRVGTIRIDGVDTLLFSLRHSMGDATSAGR